MGLEPTRPNGHKILSLARLPIPTPPQRKLYYHSCIMFASLFWEKPETFFYSM